ncbi:sulfatase family protein [Coraliomargarita akajimensis]|uniref:Sulfatase n=1 Tax=Coraliomargarita akajimensis (strain DSM 45221 / IAM 15411 / JCM 23193 / KCTC 12865 / 04OKA010-24) TaxID=583355 RepID=D5EHM1_CORAD|nr:sulfatase-like hydrolase/transferase [Coraliomargarita akajimensis]ADE54062.1 sulfatase [Coraliomargarita akajimensis DSM 45221]
MKLPILLSSLALLACQLTASSRPSFLFIMLDDIGVGQCQFNNDELTVEDFDPYFVELVKQRQDYSPQQALDFSKRAMPNLTRLANEGIIFDRAYAASSLCAPARLAVATGKIPPDAGVFTNMDVETDGIKADEHLVQPLQDSGYVTAHIGKWHIGKRDYSIIRRELDAAGIQENIYFFDLRNSQPQMYNRVWEAGYYGSVVDAQNPLNHGFDYYYGYNNWASQFYDSTLVWEDFEHAGRQAGYNTEVFTEKAIDFIQQQSSQEQPFYLQLHYHAVHDYLEPNAPDRYWNGFRSPSYTLSNFYAHINAVDQNVQRIIDYLEQSGQLANTIIVFTSDNGAMAGGPNTLPGNAPYSGHKGMFNQGGIRVPFFIYWAQGIEHATRSDALVSTMDILPTCLAAAGLQVPSAIDGKSLLPILTGNTSAEIRDHLLWAGIHAHAWGFESNRSLVTKNKERNQAPGGWAVVKGNYALRFTGTVAPELYADRPNGEAAQLHLFDLETDPSESTDIKEQLPEIASTMKRLYETRAAGFSAPVVWSQDKWQELLPDN